MQEEKEEKKRTEQFKDNSRVNEEIYRERKKIEMELNLDGK